MDKRVNVCKLLNIKYLESYSQLIDHNCQRNAEVGIAKKFQIPKFRASKGSGFDFTETLRGDSDKTC